MLDTILTPNVIKTRAYARDMDFGVGMDLLRGFHGAPRDRLDLLWNCAALLLRPDAVVGGQARRVLPMLREHGFVPVAAARVRATAAQAQALWRYQFNVATAERRAILKRLMSNGAGVYLLLFDTTRRTSAPATVHLTYLKGTAVLERRRRWHLRTIAGPSVANIFSYVHVSDDPADMLREMIVLFGRHGARTLLEQAGGGIDRTEHALSLLRQAEAEAPRGGLVTPAPATPGASGTLQVWRAHREWEDLVRLGKACRNFITGESYLGREAIVPDDVELSLPLDSHLVFRELGPPR